MAKKNTTEAGTTTERKKREPRQLSDMEREARQQYDDVRTVAKLLPSVAELSPSGRKKLAEEMAKMDSTSTGFETT